MRYEKHGVSIYLDNFCVVGTYNPETREIVCSRGSLPHELVHVIDHYSDWTLSDQLAEVVVNKLDPEKVEFIQAEYDPDHWHAEYLAWYFGRDEEIVGIFAEALTLKGAYLLVKEYMQKVLKVSSFASPSAIKSLPCRKVVKKEMIDNLFWLAEQGETRQLNELMRLIEADGISVPCKVKRTIAKKLEAPTTKTEKLNKPEWKPEAKSESHEGNSKSKAKWRKNGKEARRLSNR